MGVRQFGVLNRVTLNLLQQDGVTVFDLTGHTVMFRFERVDKSTFEVAATVDVPNTGVAYYDTPDNTTLNKWNDWRVQAEVTRTSDGAVFYSTIGTLDVGETIVI